MHVAFDTGILSVYFHPTAKPPKGVQNLPKRIQLLVDELEAAGAKIIIPAPVLCEFLVLAGPVDGAGYLSDISTSDVFDIRPFDTMAAVEASEMHRKAQAQGDKKGGSDKPWQAAKVDYQIVAIAKVNRVTRIYSDDSGVRRYAEAAGIQCKGVDDLPVPPPEDGDLLSVLVASPSTSPAQPSAQSPDAESPTETVPERHRRAIHLDDPEPPPPDSSPVAQKK